MVGLGAAKKVDLAMPAKKAGGHTIKTLSYINVAHAGQSEQAYKRGDLHCLPWHATEAADPMGCHCSGRWVW